jgi:hypothetical protein
MTGTPRIAAAALRSAGRRGRAERARWASGNAGLGRGGRSGRPAALRDACRQGRAGYRTKRSGSRKDGWLVTVLRPCKNRRRDASCP